MVGLGLHLITSMCIEATTSSSGDNSNLNGLHTQRSKLSELDVKFRERGKTVCISRQNKIMDQMKKKG